jgi:membrane fusion protein, multidrug efflux system
MTQPTLPEIEAPPQPQGLIAPPPEPAAPESPGPAQDEPRTEETQGLRPADRRRKRKWPWILSAALLLLIGFFWYRGGLNSTASQKSALAKAGRGVANAAIPVVSTKATTGDIGVYVTGLGAITPIATVTVRSRVDGQLMNVHFKEGEYVRVGDPLIDLDPQPYQAVVLQAEGALARDQALLANAKVDVDRYTTLLKQDAIPEQQLATQQALVKQYEGTVKNDQGMLDAARVNLAYCHIVSPISGIVGLRLVDAGNIVHAADTNGMIVITQLEPISVIFTVSEDQMPPILQKLHAGQKLVVEAWDRELRNKIATGALETVDNEIDPTTGTLKLRAVFNNEKRSLFPNQFVNARLLLQEKHGVTLLLSAAVQRNTNNTYVYLIQPDNSVTIRQIAVGTTEGEQSEITQGLMPGDQVVMTGVDKLTEGSKVVPRLNAPTQPENSTTGPPASGARKQAAGH